MHLWGKMAAQQQMHSQSQQQQASPPQSPQQSLQPAGLAAALRPHYFTGKNGSPLSALLSGKHTAPAAAYPSPPVSPQLSAKALGGGAVREQQQREKEQQHAMIAAMATQTVFRKLGSAFWEAFSGSSSTPAHLGSSSSASSSYAASSWDQEKVQRVLEGRAVLRVVDVEPATPPVTPKARAAVPSRMGTQDEPKKPGCGSLAALSVCDLLEDSMRSLSLGKK